MFWLLTDELSHVLKNCRPSWIFTTSEHYKTVTDGITRASIILVKVVFMWSQFVY